MAITFSIMLSYIKPLNRKFCEPDKEINKAKRVRTVFYKETVIFLELDYYVSRLIHVLIVQIP